MKAPLSFPAEARLRSKRDFVFVEKGPKRRVSAVHFLFVVSVCPGGVAGPRMGLVMTKKLGGAVARNRAKRLCRETFRRRKSELPRGIDLLVIGKPGAPDLTQAEVDGEWQEAGRSIREAARRLGAA